ncbi:cytochrome P450 [Streptomyces klenkii]
MPTTGTYTVAAAPGALPLLGHGAALLQHPLSFLEELRDLADITLFRLGRTRSYLLNNPELIHQVMVQDASVYTKGIIFEKGRQIIGNGLASSEGDFHTRQRRLMQPSFSRPNIARYAETMTDLATAMSNTWRDGGTVTVDEAMAQLSARITTKCLFSMDIAQEKAQEIEQYMGTVFDGTGRRALAPLGFWYRLPTRKNKEFNHALDRSRSLVKHIIGEYRSSHVQRHDFLSMLLAARDPHTGRPMTDQQVHDEVVTILAGGTETSSSALSSTFKLLADHPSVLSGIQDELDTVLGGRTPVHSDIAALPYLGAVVQESMRLYPPVWLLPRTPTRDTTIGDVHVPAGAQVFFSPYSLHRDRRWFPRPHRFEPERWLQGREAGLPRGAYVPFGLGGRNCIGTSFALSEIVLTLSTVCSRWTLTPVPGARPRVTALTTLHLNGLTMTTHERRAARSH